MYTQSSTGAACTLVLRVTHDETYYTLQGLRVRPEKSPLEVHYQGHWVRALFGWCGHLNHPAGFILPPSRHRVQRIVNIHDVSAVRWPQ